MGHATTTVKNLSIYPCQRGGSGARAPRRLNPLVRNAMLTEWTCGRLIRATPFAIPEVDPPSCRAGSAIDSPSRVTRCPTLL